MVSTLIRGSVGCTVTPPGVGCAGGVAHGEGVLLGRACGVAAVPEGCPPQPIVSRTVSVTVRLPVISVTRRSSSRRLMMPSLKSSTCSSSTYRSKSVMATPLGSGHERDRVKSRTPPSRAYRRSSPGDHQSAAIARGQAVVLADAQLAPHPVGAEDQ